MSVNITKLITRSNGAEQNQHDLENRERDVLDVLPNFHRVSSGGYFSCPCQSVKDWNWCDAGKEQDKFIN